MGAFVRKFLLGVAILAFLASWAGVVIVYFADSGIGPFTVAVTLAAFATEALIWALAFIAGWSIFANRRAVWDRLTGRKPEMTQ